MKRDRVLRTVGWLVIAVGLAAATDQCAGLAFEHGVFGLPRVESIERVVGYLREMSARPFVQREVVAPRSDPPDPRAPFRIGVFGGSVAFDMVRTLGEPGTERPPALAALASHLGRPVEIVQLAVRSGRQPVQYNLLRLVAARLDAAVVLDGFNEQFGHARSCAQQARGWDARGGHARDTLGVLRDEMAALEARATWRVWAWAGGSALARLYFQQRRESLQRRVYEALETLGDATPAPPERAFDVSVAARNGEWEDCVRRSDEFARSVHVPIFFFVQPNQYVVGSKRFSDEERACCTTPRGPAVDVYRSLTERLGDLAARSARLRGGGVRAYDLLGVFRDHAETLYNDDCCHTNPHGRLILAEAVFGTVAAELDRDTHSPSSDDRSHIFPASRLIVAVKP